MQLAADAVGGRPPNLGLLPLLHVTTARAHIQAGDFDEAAAVLEDGHAHPVGSPVADVARNRGVASFIAATSTASSPVRAARPPAPTESADRLGLSRHEVGRIYAGLARSRSTSSATSTSYARTVIDPVRAASEPASG